VPRSKRELAAEALEALTGRDLGRLAVLVDPEFEFHFAMIEGEPYRGVEGIGEYFDSVDSTWDDFRFELEEFHDLGDQSASVSRVRGTARASGVPLDERVAHIWTWRDEKILRVERYSDPAQAFRAVGLRE
jgi:ketosteroid isomerase-like protein